MQKTENYEMNLPEQEDFFNVDHFNQNTEKTDEILKSLENPEYEETGELAELISGEGLKKAFGKMAKAVSNLISHINNNSNPHRVTAEDVGLGEVPNVTTNDQTPTYTAATTLAELESGEKLSTAFGKLSKAVKDLISHISNTNKPHRFEIHDSTAYTRKVIGLIRLGTWNYVGGTIELYRTNGVTPNTKIEFTMQKKYNSESTFLCSYRSVGQNELKPVTFTYNGVKYAGFYYYMAAAQQENIILDIYRYGSQEPFLVQVYDTSTSTVLNEEIYNSLQTDKAEAYKFYSNGKRLLQADDIVKNLTTTTEDLPLDATMGKELNDKIVKIENALQIGQAGMSSMSYSELVSNELTNSDDCTLNIYRKKLSVGYMVTLEISYTGNDSNNPWISFKIPHTKITNSSTIKLNTFIPVNAYAKSESNSNEIFVTNRIDGEVSGEYLHVEIKISSSGAVPVPRTDYITFIVITD